MQQAKEHKFFSLVVIGITMAALMAPPSVFAETTPPVGTTPVPAPTPTLPPVPAQPAGAIRIGLGWGLSAADVAAPGGLLVIADGAVVAQLPAGQVAKLTLDAGYITLGGLAGKFQALRLVPVPPAPVTPPPTTQPPTTPPPAPTAPPVPVIPAVPANPVTYKAKTYRGEIMAVVGPVSKKLSVVNVINLDEYLLGVVPEEVEAVWPQEAVKAQAVAARTYAQANRDKWKGDGFDLVWTTSDQYYGGLASEKALASQAVMITAGQVLTYNGRLISAMYHSSSGGHTENNEIIYASQPVGYLRGVEDYDNVAGNRYYNWQYTYTVDQFVTSLKKGGNDVGAVVGVAAAGSTGVSGRPSQWQVTGSTATKVLTGSQIRSALELPSNPKSVSVQSGGMSPAVKSYTQAQTFFALGAGGVVQQRPAGGTAVAAAGKATAVVAGAVTAMGAKINQPAGVMVSGGGHGHAVGMSQWGALGMAQQGKTYAEILTHYYTGTKLESPQTQ
ncbi:MAG TPA: SpoIID/LytB domain-containing protein [Symbiobacteriaceae bacterium]|nr:SpoIID/LytB domain-containing protein [Symbiobacteriaceae bacterium]